MDYISNKDKALGQNPGRTALTIIPESKMRIQKPEVIQLCWVFENR
jgi:hypothetical protein